MEKAAFSGVSRWWHTKDTKVDRRRNVVVKIQIMRAMPGVYATGAFLATAAGMILPEFNS